MADRIRGTIWGLAVGDALGAGVEQFGAATSPRPRVIGYRAGSGRNAGQWTDDTALSLAAAVGYIGGDFNLDAAVSAMVRWYHTAPLSIGNRTALALELIAKGLASPLEAGRVLMCLKDSAGNGSLMRASPTAVMRDPEDPRLVVESFLLSGVTHADPRCIASCIAFNVIVSHLVRGADDLQDIFRAAARSSLPVCHEVGAVVLDVAAGRRPRYGSMPIGFVLLTLERALDCLWRATDYAHAILEVVNLGGDADTNGAVAGALLGARFGVQSIPDEWLEGLQYRRVVQTGIDILLEAANVVPTAVGT